MHPSRLIVLDAIDGAGKSTAIQAMAGCLAQKGLRLFDLVEFMKREGRPPEPSDAALAKADVLLSAEPTYAWIGSAIREELVRSHEGRAYGARAAAEAFALDRLILFSRVVLPFLAARSGRWVIQDRGVISSLAYQPLQDPTVTLEWLLALEGNRVELSRAPDLLLLLRLDPEEALRRITKRGAATEHIYETDDFQRRLADRYRDPAVLAPYREAGTKIVEVNAADSPEKVGEAVCRELEALSSSSTPTSP